MPAAAVSQLLYLLDEAFQGPDWHSFLSNLRTLAPEDWTWVPPGGRRSIRAIVQHVGGCKVMYHNHAFGDAQLTWDDPLVEGGDALATIPSAIGWLREGQERLWHSTAAFDDAELLRPRMTNWGERTSWGDPGLRDLGGTATQELVYVLGKTPEIAPCTSDRVQILVHEPAITTVAPLGLDGPHTPGCACSATRPYVPAPCPQHKAVSMLCLIGFYWTRPDDTQPLWEDIVDPPPDLPSPFPSRGETCFCALKRGVYARAGNV
jgi:hypothetical protein